MKKQLILNLFLFLITGTSTFFLSGIIHDSSADKTNNSMGDATGTYLLSGIQIDMSTCWFPALCEPGDVFTRDTTKISYTVYVEWVEEKQDTLQFYGLEGGDISVQGNKNSGQAASSNCRRDDGNYSDYYCPYVLLSGNELIFDLYHTGSSYVGEGTIENGIMKFETSFRYRGKRVDYIMEGPKIEYLPILD